jgi:hypothetical protein
VHVRLPESGAPADAFVPVRRRLPVRRHLPLRGLVQRPGLSGRESAATLNHNAPSFPSEVIMTTHHIGRIVIGCLSGGLVVALALVAGPVAGAQEHVITGTILLTFAASRALVALLSTRWTEQPQRWAAALASFMAVAGAALLIFAPGGVVIDALGWVWPPLLLALLAGTVGRVHRALRSRTRS